MPASPPTISVVIATYNGEPYVAEQIDSILRQTRPPDEVIVCDDSSTDRSLSITADTLDAARVPHQILEAPANLGVTANFARGISAAAGDVIVLADQDDVWYPEKLATIANSLSAPNAHLAVFSDADLIGPSGARLGSTLWARVGLNRSLRQRILDGEAFQIQMRKNWATGATMAFRSSLREAVLPMSEDGLHDHWIATIAAALGELYPVPRSLMAYRLHGRNAIGLPGGSPLAQLHARSALGDVRSREIAFHEALLSRLCTLDGVPPSEVCAAEGKLRLLRARSSLPRHRPARLIKVARHLATGEYARFSRGLRSAIYDSISG